MCDVMESRLSTFPPFFMLGREIKIIAVHLEKEASMLFKILTSASILLVIAAIVSMYVGCEGKSDMSDPVSVNDPPTLRSPNDPTSDDFVIISPSTLVLKSQGWTLTVHVAIPYSQVDVSTVRLEGVTPFSTFADDRGDLVCKFLREDIIALVSPVDEPTERELTLSGNDIEGEEFSGSDTITIR